MYKYVLFDLDGTLTDSKEGIIKSVAMPWSRWANRQKPSGSAYYRRAAAVDDL